MQRNFYRVWFRGFGAAGMVPFDSPVEVYLPCWEWGAYLGQGALGALVPLSFFLN